MPEIILNSIITLYMTAVVLRWVAPWLNLNLNTPRLRWLPAVTDPALRGVRRILPPMSAPMDWSAPALLLGLWILRILLTGG